MSAKATQPYVPAKIFRDDSTAQHFEKYLKPKLLSSEVGTRICCALEDRSETTIRSLNRYIAKNGFIYLLSTLARGDALGDKETSVLNEFFTRYEVQRGNTKPASESALSS